MCFENVICLGACYRRALVIDEAMQRDSGFRRFFDYFDWSHFQSRIPICDKPAVGATWQPGLDEGGTDLLAGSGSTRFDFELLKSHQLDAHWDFRNKRCFGFFGNLVDTPKESATVIKRSLILREELIHEAESLLIDHELHEGEFDAVHIRLGDFKKFPGNASPLNALQDLPTRDRTVLVISDELDHDIIGRVPARRRVCWRKPNNWYSTWNGRQKDERTAVLDMICCTRAARFWGFPNSTLSAGIMMWRGYAQRFDTEPRWLGGTRVAPYVDIRSEVWNGPYSEKLQSLSHKPQQHLLSERSQSIHPLDMSHDSGAASMPKVWPKSAKHPESYLKLDELGSRIPPYKPTFEFGSFINAAHEQLSVCSMDGVKIRHNGIKGFLRREDALKLYEMAYFDENDILELGSFHGLSASIMAGAARDAGHEKVIYSIDSCKQHSTQTARNLSKLGLTDYLKVICSGGHSGIQRLASEGRQFGFAFIDHSHTYKHVYGACRILKDVLLPGGFCLFHDFNDTRNKDPNNGNYGVYQAVTDGLAPEQFEFYGVYGCTGLYRRTES